MSSEGYSPIIVDPYGGLCTLMERSDLPVGLSPDCQDVQFFPGGVQSRDAFQGYIPLANKPYGVGNYVNYDNVSRRLVYDSAGQVQYESARWAALTPVALGQDGGTSFQATTAYGRTYICIGDGKRGLTVPIQWDGSDTTTSQYTPEPVSRNGADSCSAVPNAAAGSITAGYHYVSVVFETATGFITSMPGLTYWISLGGDKVDFSNIPIGPGNTTKRRLFVSPANSTDLYSLDSLVLNDNSTTTLSGISFTDADLLSGVAMADHLYLTVIGPQLGSLLYHQRMLYWGGYDRVEAFLDTHGAVSAGGFYRVGLIDTGFDARLNTLSDIWGIVGGSTGGAVVTPAAGVAEGGSLCVYQITGDGTAAQKGYIEQIRWNVGDSGSYYLQPNRKYGIRARVAKSASGTTGTLVIRLQTGVSATSTWNTITTLTVDLSTYSDTDWHLVSYDGIVAVPSSATGSQEVHAEIWEVNIPNAQKVWVDWFEVYDVQTKNAGSVIRASKSTDPESVSLLDGFITVAPGNGQDVRSCFEIRGNLYAAKERSLYAISDNGLEPAKWNVDEVSNTVGTPSVHGVGVGDGWAIICGDAGVYMYSGGMPDKLSQEIEPTWRRVNWAYGHRIWCKVDVKNQRVYIGVPLDTSTVCNAILVLDYVEGWSSPIPSGSGRKWSIWNLSAWAAELCVMDEGDRRMLFAHSPSTGESYGAINQVTSSVTYSFGGANPWSAVTGVAPTVTTGIADPQGGTSAAYWQGDNTVTANSYQTKVTANETTRVVAVSVFLKGNSSGYPGWGQQVTVTAGQASSGTYSETVTLTDSWQKVTVYYDPGSSTTANVARSLTITPVATGTYGFYIYGYQIAYSTGGQNQYGFSGYHVRPGGLTGRIYSILELLNTETIDAFGFITPIYETAPLGGEVMRSEFDRLILRIRGIGTLQPQWVRPSGTFTNTAQTFALAASPDDDYETRMRQNDTQLGIRLATTMQANWYWILKRMAVLAKMSVATLMRGRNP